MPDDTLDPGELVAQLPYALGFYPRTETVVVVSDATSRRLWDFPPDHPAVEVAAAIAARCPDPDRTRVTPLVYAGQVDFSVELDASDLATALTAHFASVDSPLIVTPAGWRHAVDCPQRCCAPDDTLNAAVLPPALAHEAATKWPTPMPHRADLAGYFTSDPLQRTLLTAARAPAARQQRTAILSAGSPAAWRHAATAQAWTHLTDTGTTAPTVAARTLLQLQDTYVADAIVLRILADATAAGDQAMVRLRELCRAAPNDLATTALSAWAHAAAARGDTPRAFTAIHRAQTLSPRHNPTSVLRRLLIAGVEPDDLAAVRLPEASLLNTPEPISPAVVSTVGDPGGPPPLPPAAGPPPPAPGRSR